MTSKMKAFRASEDTQYMMKAYSEYCGVSESKLVEMALDWFYSTGAANAIADLKKLDKYETWPEFTANATRDGKIRELTRRSNGLGIAPVTML